MGTITLEAFIRRLYLLKDGEDTENALTQARQEGWLSAEDAYDPSAKLKRQTAARILHEYARIVKGLEDLKDISEAARLRDLYDCRLCVNHIAQVYLRGLMEAKEIPGISDRGFFIFDHKREVTEEEAEGIIRRLEALPCN